MIVKKGQYKVIDEELGQQDGKLLSTSPGSGPRRTMPDVASGNRVGQTGAKPRAASAQPGFKQIDWESIVATLSGSSSLSSHMTEQGRRILQQLTKKKPLVDWRKYLKKFVDRSTYKEEYVIPKRRFVGSGIYMYGTKKIGKEGFRTAVIACDTSGSISKDQTKTFLTEAMTICETFFIDKLYIIYCSDGIDDVDTVDLAKGGKPDFSKWATTGGNLNGFAPPFKWVEEQKITPSFFIYFTDGLAVFPSTNIYINKYAKKVMWFILSKGNDLLYGGPKFGQVFEIPNNMMKPTK